MTDVNQTAKRYVGIGLMLVIVLWVVSLTVSVLRPDWQLTAPICVSVVFSVVMLMAFAVLWKWVSQKHHDQITTFYTATSGFRMLAAIFTMLGCYLVAGREAMTPYVVVFMIYYFVMVGFHAAYFSRVAKREDRV